MFTKLLSKRKIDLIIFLFLAIIVGFLQFILLKPQLNFGFTPDDWWPLVHYKYLSSDILTNLLQVWKKDGIYTSYQVIYISILHNFFGFNFQAYQITNIVLKGLSALMVYPLILTVFKNRILAILTTILYAMAYSPVGTLEIVVRGSDFIGIIFMCLFFIAYYKVITSKTSNIFNLITPMILLSLSMFFSPIRIYPILTFILLIEIYLFLTNRSRTSFIKICKRTAFIFLPYILIVVLSPSSIISFTSVNAPAILSRISIGNWQLLLYPLGSLGSLFSLNDYWNVFGGIKIQNLNDYIIYLLTGPFIIFFLITLFYSFILSIPHKKIFKFVISTLATSLVLLILVFILAKHSESISQNLRMGYDYVELYPVFFVVFILSITFSFWHEWINNNKGNKLLLALWIGPIFSFTHIIFTWIFKDYVVLFKGIHTYLNIPSIGISLFIASTIGLLYQKLRSSCGILGKLLAFQVFLLLILIFIINKSLIDNYYFSNSYSMDVKEHEAFRNRVWNKLTDFNNRLPSIFYFDSSGDYLNGRFYEQSMLGRFSDWMFFKGHYPPGSCELPIFINQNLQQLKDKFIEKNGEFGFLYVDYCGQSTFYKLKQFYAFRLMNKEPFDIKDEVLQKLKEK